MRKAGLSLALAVFAAAAFLLLSGAAQDADTEERLWRQRNLGKALFETPSTQAQSVAELKKALDIAPDSVRERINYGIALLRTGKNREAIAELEKAQKQDPTLPHTWFNLGIAYKREAQFENAIRQFEGFLKLVPDEPVAYYNLGLMYNLTNREADAMKEFETAAALDDKLVAPRFQIYNIYRLLGRDEEAKKALASFQDAKARQKEADDSEDMDWCYWAELYDPVEAQGAGHDPSPPAALAFETRRLPGSADAATAGMELIDLDGGGKTSLIVWSRNGILVYAAGTAPVANSGLQGIKDVRAIAVGDFDNDGLADLCVVTASGASIYRNAKGRFEKHAAELPGGDYETAVWLDYDHEYDADLMLLGARSVLLRNEGGGKFAEAKFSFEKGRAIAAVTFRVVPDSKGWDLAVSYADRPGVLYRDRMRGVYTAEPLDAVPAGARALQAIDVDNDSWTDLAWSAAGGPGIAVSQKGRFSAVSAPAVKGRALFADVENRGIEDLIAGGVAYRNEGRAGAFAQGRSAPGLPEAAAIVSADFDGDGRLDLAVVTPAGTVELALNRTETKNNWISISLTGLKNLKLAGDTEVEIKAGRQYQKKIYRGVPLLFGLRGRSQADTVRVLWPNGLIQNETDQKALQVAALKEAPRLSGSCPMIFTWNGNRFQYIGDVLGTAPLGASSGDGSYFPVDHDEYIHLPGGALSERNGRFDIRITEELREVTYLDEARLIAADHPADVELFTNDKFKSPPFPEFRLFGVKRRVYPVAARQDGIDVRSKLLRLDGVYPTFRRDLMGQAETHTLDLDFGSAAPDNRAVLVMSGWVDWADGSTFLNAAQTGNRPLVFPSVQVKDASGNWRTVIEDMGIPSGTPKTIVVDLTGKFLSASREVRIVTNLCVYWDRIFLSEETASPPVRMTEAKALAADLRLRGFSRNVVHATREQPEYFEYSQWTPAAPWDQAPGKYTRYGDVHDLILAADDRYVIMGPGDEIRLEFDARSLPPLPAGWKRDFLLRIDGWSKDGDLNTAFAESVEPLPFHGMSSYPYPASERFPDTPAHRLWREKYNTRPPVRLISRLAARAD
ncbi:MAG: FG-GAP-like repeat-containing protein [bacterium]